MSIAWFTLWQAVVTVALSLVVGAGFALFERARGATPARWFVGLCALPVFLPTLLVSLGFVSVFGNAGWVNAALEWAGVPTVQWLYSARGVVAAHVFYNAPLVYLLIAGRLATMDRHLEDAARLSGASAWRAFCDITWPRLRPSVIGASVVVFLYAFVSFGAPLVLGGLEYATIEVAIFRRVQQLDVAGAAWLGAGQTVFLLAIVLLAMRPLVAVREERIAVASTRASWSVRLSRLCAAGALLTPLVAVGTDAFLVRTRGTQEWGLHNIAAFFRADAVESMLLTLALASSVALCVVVVGQLLVTRFGARVQRPLIAVLALSPVTLSLVLRATTGPSLAALALVLALLALPIATLVLLHRAQSQPLHMQETAALLGANKKQRRALVRHFQLPAFAQAAVLAIALVIADISIASMLAPHTHPTLMKLSYQLLSGYHFHVAAVGMLLSLLLIAAAGLLLPLTTRYVSRRF